MFEGRTLHDHLIADGFFCNGVNTLNIIDDYHTKNITPDAIEFYLNSFRDTELQELNIYYQIKSVPQRRIREGNRLADALFYDLPNYENDKESFRNSLLSFAIFVCGTLDFDKKQTLEQKLLDLYRKRHADRIIESSLDFICRLKAVANVTVNYHLYSSLNLKPPFHGRYWINDNAGYIVDGSLNTYTHGKVFAQMMDRENYDTIKGLFDTRIVPNAAQFAPLDFQSIVNIHERLRRHFQLTK